jgi:hypothetical protein
VATPPPTKPVAVIASARRAGNGAAKKPATLHAFFQGGVWHWGITIPREHGYGYQVVANSERGFALESDAISRGSHAATSMDPRVLHERTDAARSATAGCAPEGAHDRMGLADRAEAPSALMPLPFGPIGIRMLQQLGRSVALSGNRLATSMTTRKFRHAPRIAGGRYRIFVLVARHAVAGMD